MININFSQVNLEKGNENVTGKAGLAWFYSAMQHFSVGKIIDKEFPVPLSNASYQASGKLFPMLMTFIGGGNKIEDIEVMRKETALANMCGLGKICCADTIRNILAEDSTTACLQKVLDTVSVKAIQKSDHDNLTFDIDWTDIESEKDSAAYSYKKTKSYGVLSGAIPEIALIITNNYRPGNVSPANGIEKQIRKAHSLIKKTDKTLAAVRSDSAGHSKYVINTCEDLKIKYYISMSQNDVVKEAMEAIPEKSWKKLKDNPDQKWAETLYPMAGLDPDRAVRIMVLRWENPDPTLFDTKPYCYHVIGTNDLEIENEAWLKFHNGRMGSENYHKELKHGFGLKHCPSHSIKVNRNFFLLGLMAYNLFQVFKRFYLAADYFPWSIRTFRWHFVSVCGKLVCHAKKFTYRILNVTDKTFEMFRQIQQKLCFS